MGIEGGAFAKGQLRSYMRTPVAYYTAQLISQSGFPCIVMGTGNMDEDGYLLYFCKVRWKESPLLLLLGGRKT